MLLGGFGAAQTKDDGACGMADFNILGFKAQNLLGPQKEAKSKQQAETKVPPLFLEAKADEGLKNLPWHWYCANRCVLESAQPTQEPPCLAYRFTLLEKVVDVLCH